MRSLKSCDFNTRAIVSLKQPEPLGLSTVNSKAIIGSAKIAGESRANVNITLWSLAFARQFLSGTVCALQWWMSICRRSWHNTGFLKKEVSRVNISRFGVIPNLTSGDLSQLSDYIETIKWIDEVNQGELRDFNDENS